MQVEKFNIKPCTHYKRIWNLEKSNLDYTTQGYLNNSVNPKKGDKKSIQDIF